MFPHGKEVTQGISFLTFKEGTLAIYKDFKNKSLKSIATTSFSLSPDYFKWLQELTCFLLC